MFGYQLTAMFTNFQGQLNKFVSESYRFMVFVCKTNLIGVTEQNLNNLIYHTCITSKTIFEHIWNINKTTNNENSKSL